MQAAHASDATVAASMTADSLLDDYSDTDDESYYAARAFDRSAVPHVSDIDPDAQIEALDEDIIVGTSNSVLLSENECAVKLTMQLIRESVRSAAATERPSERDSDGDPDSSSTTNAPERDDNDDNDDAEIDALLQKKILRLDWLNIGRIENLDAFTHVQELYLQHNLVRRIENLDEHRELTFLALGGNRIERVEGLRRLTNLKFLDLSNNCIEDFDIREFPESLMIVRLAGNPFIRHMPSYVHLFFERLPHIVQVDEFRRAQALPDSDTGASALHATATAASAAVYSPRSRYVELEMEVELSQNALSLASPAPAPSSAQQSDVDSEIDVLLEEFDLATYEVQREQRLRKWREQRQGVETRRAELGSGVSVGIGVGISDSNTASAAAAALHSKTLARAREGTKSAIANSISHFQQMELEHKQWQEQQMLSS